MKILLIEDDIELGKTIFNNLLSEGFKVDHSIDVKSSIEKLNNSDFELVIIEQSLIHNDEGDFFECLKKKPEAVPVLVTGVAKNLSERLKGLRNGGDDYLMKPFEVAELYTKIETLLKNKQIKSRIENLKFIDIHLNIVSRDVVRGKRKIELQPREFTLLHFLIEHQGKIVTKAQIIERVWGYTMPPKTNVVDVLVCRLRNKIDSDHEVKTIHTIRGLGYCLKKY